MKNQKWVYMDGYYEVRELLMERVNERLGGMKNLKRNRISITLEEALIK